ncbi:MAG TPA: VOC family protein [Casimicrobiaceae bacterium]|nr:VOC family protein [Casimicrobiaceae bacterium]
MDERARISTDVGVHSLDHFALAVPNLSDARTFYGAFGLDVKDEQGTLGLYARGNPHRWGVVRADPRRHLAWLSFGAYARDLPRFEERLKKSGVAAAAPPAGARDDGLWFHDMDGSPVHIGVADKSSPDAKVPLAALECASAGARGARKRSEVPHVNPRRLSHVLRFTPNVPRAVAFYEDVLGMRLSDRSGDGIAFLHAVHGSDHHVVAFAKSDAPGYHHSSWDVGSLEEVGLGGMQMAAKGHTHGWGPGRHVLGSNYFWYVQDPWGSFAEYSADIDYVPAATHWNAADYPPDDAFYLWGPGPPQDFVTNYESTVR